MATATNTIDVVDVKGKKAGSIELPAELFDVPTNVPLIHQVQRWRDAGNPVVGIQIDFDARTQYLNEYADFLRDLRQRLPKDLRLSITGLMDWSSNADPAAIAQLKGVIDEHAACTTRHQRHSH